MSVGNNDEITRDQSGPPEEIALDHSGCAEERVPHQSGCAEEKDATKTTKHSSRETTRLLSLLLVYFTVAVDGLGVFILIPILPFLVGAKKSEDSFSKEDMGGLTPGIAMSSVMTSYNFSQLLSVLAFGPLSDRFGRKTMLLVSLMGSVVGYSLTGVAIAIGHFYLLIAMRILTGLFGGSRPVAVAFIADSAPPEQRAKLLGLLALAMTFAMQVGPLLGGSLGSIGMQFPPFTAAGISLITFFLVWALVVEVRSRGPKSKNISSNSDSKEDRIALVLNGLLAFTSGFWMTTQVFSFTLLLPKRYGFDTNKVGLTSMGDGIMVLLGNPVYLLLIRRIRVPLVAAVGCLLMAVIVVCPYLEIKPLLVLRYLAGLGAPLAMPASSAIVALIAPSHRRGLLAGLTVAAMSLGRSVAPLILGAAFDEDYHLPFLIGSCVILVGMISTSLLAPRVRPPGEKQRSALDSEAAQHDFKSDGQEPLNKEELLFRLHERQESVRQRLKSLEDQQPDPDEKKPEVSAEQKLAIQKQLSDWLVKLLESHGYNEWFKHLEGIRLMLYNSFPPLRHSSREEKFRSLLQLFDNHISMAERSDDFDGSEDLVQAHL